MTGDQRRWQMKCVVCGKSLIPVWEQVEWEESNPLETARWVCE